MLDSFHTLLRSTRRGSPLLLALLLVPLTLGLVACEPEEAETLEETGEAAEEQLEAVPPVGTADAELPTDGVSETGVPVALDEFVIEMPSEVEAGTVTFRVHNAGTVEHSFEVEGQGMEKQLEENVVPDANAVLVADLEPGTYRVYCPVADHAQKGMEMQLTVTGGGTATATEPPPAGDTGSSGGTAGPPPEDES